MKNAVKLSCFFSLFMLYSCGTEPVTSEVMSLNQELKPEIKIPFTKDGVYEIGHSFFIENVLEENISKIEMNDENCHLLPDSSLCKVPMRMEQEGNHLKITPHGQFTLPNQVQNPSWSSVDWAGMRPGGTYTLKVFFKNGLFDEKIIKVKDVDYGFYFLDENANFQKWVNKEINPYFDPQKPTIIYIHGWQSGSIERGFWLENPFIYTWPGKLEPENTLPYWKAKGYNVACFYWPQFSDEKDVTVAEGKIWSAFHGKKESLFLNPKIKRENLYMRFKTIFGEYKENKNTYKSITDMFIEEYISLMKKYEGKEITFFTHSLGTQLTLASLRPISNLIDSKIIPKHSFPKKVVTFDPYWSQGGKSYLGGKWTGEASREILDEVLKKHSMVFEIYKTSPLGGLVADENRPIKAMAAFYRIFLQEQPFTQFQYQHIVGIHWYASSIKQAAKVSDGGVAGALASFESIQRRMNYYKSSWDKIHFEATTQIFGPQNTYFTQKKGHTSW